MDLFSTFVASVELNKSGHFPGHNGVGVGLPCSLSIESVKAIFNSTLTYGLPEQPSLDSLAEGHQKVSHRNIYLP